MASTVDQQLYDLTEQISRLVGTLGGSRANSPWTPPKQPVSTKTKLNAASKKLENTFTGLHGGVENFSHALTKAAGGIAILEGAVALFRGWLEMGKSFSKMSDTGQLFGGSMLKMGAAAGAAGLTLDEMTTFLTKNSVVAGAMNAGFDSLTNSIDRQVESSDKVTDGNDRQSKQIKKNADDQTKNIKTQKNALLDLQVAVREELEVFGLFGMSMGEVTGAVGDYMETLRGAGMLNKLGEIERQKAVTDMLAQVSELNQVFNTSRAQIIKTTNEAMQQTNFAARLAIEGDKQRAESGQQWISFFAAIPGQTGAKLANMFAEQVGKGGYTDTTVGKGFIETGSGQLNAILRSAETMAPTIENQAQVLGNSYDYLLANANRLNTLSKNPKYAAAANMQLQMLSDMQNAYTTAGKFDKAKYVQAMKDAAENKKITDRITTNSLAFESTYKRITGGFLDGFYEAFSEMVGGGKGNEAEFKKTLESIRLAFLDVGKAVGSFAGLVGKMLPVLSETVNWFAVLARGIRDFIDVALKKFSFDAISSDWSKAIASVAGVVLPLVALWMLKNRAMGAIRGASGLATAADAAGRRAAPGKKPGFFGRLMGRGGQLAETAAGLAGGMAGECCCGAAGGVATAASAAQAAADLVPDKAKAGAKSSAKPSLATKAGEKAAGLAARAGEKAAGVAAKAAGLAAKSASKLIPGLGALVGAKFAYDAYKEGDYVGAGLEMASGLATFIPGFGTAIAGVIQAGLIAREAYGKDATDALTGKSAANTPKVDPAKINDPSQIKAQMDKLEASWQETMKKRDLDSAAGKQEDVKKGNAKLEELIQEQNALVARQNQLQEEANNVAKRGNADSAYK